MTDLDLSQTKVSDKGAAALRDALLCNKTVATFDLRQTQLTADGAGMLLEAFLGAPALTRLNGIECTEYERHPPEEVRLEGQQMRLPEAIILRAVLTRPGACLRSLSLARNQLGAKAAEQIARLVGGLPTVTELDLSANRCGAAGCTHVARLLERHKGLVRLSIASNNITNKGTDSQGVAELMRVMRDNSTLTELNLTENDIPEHEAAEVLEHVTVNRALTFTPATFGDYLEEITPEALKFENAARSTIPYNSSAHADGFYCHAERKRLSHVNVVTLGPGTEAERDTWDVHFFPRGSTGTRPPADLAVPPTAKVPKTRKPRPRAATEGGRAGGVE